MDPAPPTDAKPPVDVGELLEFLFRLAQALLASGEQTATVELTLRRAAAAYRMRRSRVVAFPTAIFISLNDGEQDRVTLAEGPTQNLRLDQIAGVYELRDLAQRGQIAPRAGLDQLAAVLRQPARFGGLGVVLGHIVLSVGVAMVLMPAARNLVATAVLGGLVGVVKVLNRNRPLLAVPLPVISAGLVSSLVFFAIEQGLAIDPLHVLVPPLVSFLPGGMLTLGMVELAYGDMVSGSSRLVAGFVQLVLLALGLGAGALLVGYLPENLTDESPTPLEPLWALAAPWLGVIVFGTGAFIHFSAPRGALPWMLVVLLVAFGAQQVGAALFGKIGSGFFGMLAVTPLGYLIQLRFRGPPAIVTFLPSFWLLVPGALGLLSVTRMFSDRGAGIDGLVNAVFALTSIALGSLMGAAIYKLLTEQFGAWPLQLGRVGRYFRRTRKK
ncbi:MAG: threonine/serine exporter family protein [Pirellulaceae bacterium]|nr:threonine/serine exporter family protein [Pirellulaceae bacterium]